MNQIRALSGTTWQKILELLGTGDFIRIEFRPPHENEEYLCKISRAPGDIRTWWICEATYPDCTTTPEGAVVGCDHVTRVFAFPLHDEDMS